MVVRWVNVILLRVPEYCASARVLVLCIDRSSRPIPRASASAERDARSASAERVDRGAATVRAHAWSAREVSLFVSRAPALKRTGTAS